jgi:predicted nucleic-acid-binding protein
LTEEREDIINAFEQILDEVGFHQGRKDLMLLMEEKRNWYKNNFSDRLSSDRFLTAVFVPLGP